MEIHIHCLIILVLLFLGYYIYKLYRFKKLAFMENNLRSADFKSGDKVSIIACARNEEDNLPSLLEALLNQEYDLTDIEIIIVNDQSTDKTEDILKEYSNKYNFIKYINITNRDYVISPKKNALSHAIEMADGEILLLTDADCVPSKDWISSHVSIYNKHPETDMIVGFAKIAQAQCLKLSQVFEYIDFLILMFAAQGAIQAGHPYSCSGQNLSYKKSCFQGINGFEDIDHFISGDDLMLMQKFVKYGKIIRFAAFSDAYTETKPAKNWKAFINQRARWASNLKAMLKMNFSFFFYLFTCFLCIGIMPLLIIPYIIKCFFDISFINHSLKIWDIEYVKKMRSNSFLGLNLNYIIIWFLISPFYVLVVTVRGIFSLFKWKDRRG